MILNPWQGTFNQLGLAKHWWHRLCVVTFFIALVLMLGASWFLAFTSLKPVNSSMPEIQYWMTDTSGNPLQVNMDVPCLDSTPVPCDEFIVNPEYTQQGTVGPIRQRVLMPDGATVEFSGKTWKTDAEIKRNWNKALHKDLLKAWTLSISIAIGITLSFSYLLQGF